jgi:pimeloyl-ACP methyl ester carboxylesterase
VSEHVSSGAKPESKLAPSSQTGATGEAAGTGAADPAAAPPAARSGERRGEVEHRGLSAGSFKEVQTADLDGVKLGYREQGDGEPVVLVHGSASDLRTWEQQLPAIGASYRAIAYSRRYAWPNQDIEPDADDQMLRHVDDLVAFVRALAAAPAHLVGHSWGAFICLLAAIRQPRLVRSLVLAEPPVLTLFTSVPPRPAELLALFARRPATALAILGFGATTHWAAQKAFRRGDDEAGLRKMSHGMLGSDAYERLPQERKRQARQNLNTLRAQVLGAGFPPLSEHDVRSVAAPTLLIAGARSPAYPLRLIDRLQQLLPNAERVDIADASHLMHEENAPAVNRAILDFLSRTAAARRVAAC